MIFSLKIYTNKLFSNGILSKVNLIALLFLCLVFSPDAAAEMLFWPARINYQVAPGIMYPDKDTGDQGMITSLDRADLNEDGHEDLIYLSTILGDAEQTTLEVLLWDNALRCFKTPSVSIDATGPYLPYVTGLFTNDTHVDAAMLKMIEDTGAAVALYAGNGNGSFTLPAAGTYYDVEDIVPAAYLNDTNYLLHSVADFNLDNNLDLAVIITWEDDTDQHGYISILPGDGNGAFGAPVLSEDFGVEIFFSTSADFNGDGTPDIAFTYEQDGNETIRVLLGNGDGSFTSHALIDNMGIFNLITADFNNDGNMDLASVFDGTFTPPGESLISYPFSMSLGNGDGTFLNPAGVYDNGDEPYDLSAADFNNDGYIDLAIANRLKKTISIFLWDNGEGDFAADPIIQAKGYYNGLFSPVWYSDPFEIVTSDFNNNGFADMTVTSLDYSVITTFFGDGTGHFAEAPTIDTDDLEIDSVLVVADFNGDGLGDMATTACDYTYDDVSGTYTINNNYINIYQGDGTGNFADPVQYTVEDVPAELLAEDFNNDGALDLAVLNAGDDSVTILLGNGLGVFTQTAESPVAVGNNPAGIHCGDFNSDGALDLATVNIENEFIFDEGFLELTERGSFSILLGDGAGTFTEAPGSPFDAEIAPNDVTVSDFNNDGNDDLAIVNISECTFSVYLSSGSGEFTHAGTNDVLCSEPLLPPDEVSGVPFFDFVLFVINSNNFKVFSGDFDGDGTIDVIIANASGGSLKVFKGNGDGSFDPEPLEGDIGYGMKDSIGPFSPSLPLHFDTADINGDGVTEMMATNGIVEDLFIISLDQNDEIITSELSYAVGGIPVWFTFGDVDGDENSDVITGNIIPGESMEKNISILFNNSPAVPTNLSAHVTSISSIQLDWIFSLLTIKVLWRNGYFLYVCAFKDLQAKLIVDFFL
jgi:hypothetical protein